MRRAARSLGRAVQPIDGDEKIWSLQYFNQFVEKHSFVVARPGLQVFF